MATKKLEEESKSTYFKSTSRIIPSVGVEEGTRDLFPLYPFIISGGSKTERWYFRHISDLTEYHFNLKPEYFGSESSYCTVFPRLVREILARNAGAKVFCVFDWDTVYHDSSRLRNHAQFETALASEISSGTVVLCPSMPCIEYWFYLHFCDDTSFYRNYQRVSGVLAPFLKSCFPNPGISFKNLMKKGKYLQDSTWVYNLIHRGDMNMAMERAEATITRAEFNGTLDRESYTFVYKVFKP